MEEAGAELSYPAEFLLIFPQDRICYKEDKTLLRILHPVAFPEHTALDPDSLRTEASSAHSLTPCGRQDLQVRAHQASKVRRLQAAVCFC